MNGVPRDGSLAKSIGDNPGGKGKHHVNRVEFGRCHLAVEEVGPGERKAMKRQSHIMPEVLKNENVSDAIDEVLKKKKRKESKKGKEILENKQQVIMDTSQSLGDGSFELGEYREAEIKEFDKIRRIQIFPEEKRIGVNATMRVTDAHLKPLFIRTTSASIKGRGMTDLLNYIRSDIRMDPEGTMYCWKGDIKGFYDNINQDIVMNDIRRTFKDPSLVELLEKYVRLLPNGLSKGLRSSQGLANLHLSIVLDHPLKDGLGVKYYYRYCDDLVVLSGSKKELWKIRDFIHKQVGSVGLEIKPNERVFPISEGIDFLGYVIYSADHVELRKRNKQKSARKLKEVKSKKRRHELVASLYGQAKHADCNNLFQTLTGIKMKSFKDLGVSYAPADGKKRFPGPSISIRELVNLPIVVKDYETGIRTDQGDDRTLVAIEKNGEPFKFFTSSIEMRNILEQIKEVPDGFPFETTIKAETFGKGKTKYIFT